MKPMKELKTLVGHRIRSYREQRHLTQERLAELAGFYPTYIGQLERGEKNPTIETMWKISRALCVPMSVLFEDIDLTESGNRSFPAKCYDLVMEQSLSDQEKLYRLMEEIAKYGK